MLDKQSPVPLYYQLAEMLRERIHSGQLRPGDQLPAERELSDQAGISRMTARQAVAYLVRQGMLEVKPGIGTFVAAPKLTHDALHLLSFTEEMMRHGGAVSSRVLEQSVTTAPLRVAAGLRIAAGDPVVKIVRLRLVDGAPLLLETIFAPARLCPGLERALLENRSLYAILEEEYGLHLQFARQTIEATVANEFESEIFAIPLDTPMLLLEGVAYDQQERPVESFKAIYRGDRFKFELAGQRNHENEAITGASRMNIVMK
jgi:GntR family transcriptional regulator